MAKILQGGGWLTECPQPLTKISDLGRRYGLWCARRYTDTGQSWPLGGLTTLPARCANLFAPLIRSFKFL
jgi:hypothetical protein